MGHLTPLTGSSLLNMGLNCQLQGNGKNFTLHHITVALIMISRDSNSFVHARLIALCFLLQSCYNVQFLDGGILGHKYCNFLLHRFPIGAPFKSFHGFKNSSIHSSRSCFLLRKSCCLPHACWAKSHWKRRRQRVPQRDCGSGHPRHLSRFV